METLLYKILPYMETVKGECVATSKISFRPTPKTSEILEKYMEEHKTTKSRSINQIIENFAIQLEPSQKKEEWKKRVEAEANLPLMLSDFEVPCYYRAVTSKGDLYCDDKKMAKEVCIQRQKRHLSMKRMCMPSALKKKRASQSKPSWNPKSGNKGDTRLWRG